MPVQAAALPRHHLQDLPLPPAHGDGDFLLAARRARLAGAGAGAGTGTGTGTGDGARAQRCPLPTARRPGAASNGSAKGPNKGQGQNLPSQGFMSR